jgi:anaerobic magnesium-protoporphyrin IX monomethyl ester cyclase
LVSINFIDILDDKNNDDRENLGLASIGAFLREKKINVDFHSYDFTEVKSLKNDFKKYDIYGFSCYPNTINYVFQFAKMVKNSFPNSLVCIGGRLATVAGLEILNDCKEIDFIVKGYGEIPMLDVVNALKNNEKIDSIPSILTRNSLNNCNNKIENYLKIENMPFPARDFLQYSIKRGNYTARINTTFGCYGSCTFCSVNSYKRKWEGRCPKDIFEEIELLNTKYNITSFYFNDASFEDPPNRIGKKRIADLCNLLLSYENKLAFRCSMRAESFTYDDIELIKLMKRAGFTQIFLGIEAGDIEDLKLIFNKRANIEENIRALKLFKSNEIDIIMGFIMLNPFSTKISLQNNYNFLKNQEEYRIDPFIRKIDVYFGTPLHKKLLKAGLLYKDFSYNTPNSYFFKDSEIEKIDNFLNEIRTNPLINKYDGKLYHYTCVLNNLRAIFPNSTDIYFQEFKLLCSNISSVLLDYFALIYCEFNLQKAKDELINFTNKISILMQNLDSFIFKLMYNKIFREYFLEQNINSY